MIPWQNILDYQYYDANISYNLDANQTTGFDSSKIITSEASIISMTRMFFEILLFRELSRVSIFRG